MAVFRDLGPCADGEAAEERQVELLYQVVGRGTTLLAETLPGQFISVVGPLGRGFPISAGSGLAILVGGGSGIASLYELAQALIREGRPVLVILGARSKPGLLARSDFAGLDVELLFDGGQDLGLTEHRVAAPRLVGVEGHELDEAHRHPAISSEAGEVDDLVVVDPFHHHDVDLHGIETDLLGGLDPFQHLFVALAAGDFLETLCVESIQRDIDSSQPLYYSTLRSGQVIRDM